VPDSLPVNTVYRSKVDAWLLAILAFAIGVAAYAILGVFSQGSPAARWAAGLIAAVGIGFPVWLLLSTYYTLEPRKLVVRSGPFKWRIPLADIAGITPTSNPLSSPALSLDRLRIDYASGNTLMISPRNKEQFLREIEALRRVTP
jgi:membrane protein YdbS with pleckstrin-like domain